VTDLVGWLATAVFLSSYLVRPAYLLRLQIAGALVWVGYGVLLTAAPIIAANLLLIAAASWSWHRRRKSPSSSS
jgi:hypothetical protein